MESRKSLTEFYEWFKQFKVVEKAVKALSKQEDQQVLWPAKQIKCLIGVCCCAWNPSNNHFGARNWFMSQYWISSMFQKSSQQAKKLLLTKYFLFSGFWHSVGQLQHSPYFPNMAPCDFFYFCRQKICWKGGYFKVWKW